MTTQSRRLFLVLAFAVLCPLLARAQEHRNDPAVSSTDASSPSSEDEKTTEAKGEIPAKSELREKAGNYDNSLGLPFVKNILVDQKAIWTSPSRLRLHDATWLVPLGGLTAGLLATDSDVSRHLSNSPNRLDTSRNLSNFGTASLIGAAGGLYLWGKATRDDHKQETGLLSGEALLNGLAFSTAIKFSTGRERPREDKARGSFGQGGSSFPSDHAVAAWSVASVIAHEYPGPLTKLLAYGLASAVSASRVTAKEHFPSDALVGSAIGWFVGQQVYRAHHNPDLGGGTWDTFAEAFQGESRRKPANMGSPYVPLDSWIYPALERFAALGYVQTAFLGMRPWTRLECARLVDEAADHLRGEEADPPEPGRLYRALEKEFKDELTFLGGGRNRKAHLESIYTRFTDIAGKPLTDGYHFGQTIINDYGRPYEEGANALAGFSGWATAGPFVAYVRGEYQHAPSAPALPDAARQAIAAVDALPVQPPTPLTQVDRFHLLDSYVAMNWENWQISFGKQSLWWGPGQGGPLIFGDNFDPITMFRINRVAPFKLPSILGWLGPMRTEFFVGQLSGQQFVRTPTLIGQWGHPVNPQPFLHGEKISFKPTPNLELSVSRTVIFAGEGIPLTWRTFFRSMVSTAGGTEKPRGSNDPGDRQSGFDFSYRVPGLRKWLVLYTDAFADDEISPVGYPRRSAIYPGVYLPQLPKLPRLDLRVEAGYTDLPTGLLFPGFIYFSVRYANGYTNNGALLGSWMGRQGQGVQAWSTYWLSPKNTIQLSYRHQKVSGQFLPRGGTLNDAAVRADLWVRPDLSLSSSVQYEKWNFPVLSPRAQSNLTTSFQFTFWPRWGN
jgi:hypothetical protein